MEKKEEQSYLEYRLRYQIIPIYEEYIKDGIIKQIGKENLINIIQGCGVEFLKNFKIE